MPLANCPLPLLPLGRWWLGLWLPICQQLASSGPASAFRLSPESDLRISRCYHRIIEKLSQHANPGLVRCWETDVGGVSITNMSAVMDGSRTNSPGWGGGWVSRTQVGPALQVIDRCPVGWSLMPHPPQGDGPGHHVIPRRCKTIILANYHINYINYIIYRNYIKHARWLRNHVDQG